MSSTTKTATEDDSATLSGTQPLEAAGLDEEKEQRHRQQNGNRRHGSKERKTPPGASGGGGGGGLGIGIGIGPGQGPDQQIGLVSHSVIRRQHDREQEPGNEQEPLLRLEDTPANTRTPIGCTTEIKSKTHPSKATTTSPASQDDAQAIRMVSAANDEPTTEASPSTQEQQNYQRRDPVTSDKTNMEAEFERKWSQCSADSQASTSFACSLNSSLLDSSRRSSSVCIGLDQQNLSLASKQLGGPANGARRFLIDKLSRKSNSIVDSFNLDQRQPLKRGHLQLQQQHTSISNGSLDNNNKLEHHPSRKASGPNQQLAGMGRRTISQSMLELDESCLSSELNKFEVSWRNLKFAYEPRSWPAQTTAWLGASLGIASKQAPNSNLVLRDVSGSFKSNQLVAIIGPSGCGKTTLLQFLAGNNRAQCDQLRIKGLAEPKVAYIGQDDALLPGLTARETLMYASRLQNSRPGFDHAQHIKPILSELGLVECAERNVSKLSGGQAKRVTIAQELLYPTNLLILDEVTSGLDASTSYSIVKLLKYLVSDQRYPMSIVMSIHQPSARLFAVFDQVYVMSEGCCLYEGSCELTQINAYLDKFGLVCPQYHNIADYLIELACCTSNEDHEQSSTPGSGRSTRRESVTQGDDRLLLSFNESHRRDGGYLQSGRKEEDKSASLPPENENQHSTVRDRMIEYQRKLQESRKTDECGHLMNMNGHTQTPPSSQDDTFNKTAGNSYSLYLAIELARSRRVRPFCDHFRIHLSRSLMRIRRSYILTYLQLLTYIVLGLQLATFYGADIGRLSGCPRLPSNLMSYVLTSNSNQGDEDDLALEVRRIQENMNFLLVTVMTATFAALEITVITFPLEAKTVKREWRNGWYRTSSYFMGRTLADLPFQLVFVMIFCLLIYVLTGQIGLTTWRFPAFVATVVMTALVAQSFGFIFGAMFMDNLPAAVFTAPLAIFPALLFSGFFSRVSQIPGFYLPMTYLSHFRYAFDALLVALYGYDRCNCDQAALDQYHASMRNQTSSMRDMFGYLFGGSDCGPSSTTTTETVTTTPAPLEEHLATAPGFNSVAGDISHDDLDAIQASNSTLAAQVLQTIQQQANQTATVAAHSAAGSASFMKPIEDALIDGLFEQMSHQNSTGGGFNDSLMESTGETADMSVMDRLAARFSSRLTTMLNKQSNFGHQMPTECRQFNSYLLTEFDLHDEDLIFGLVMLFLVVILTRLLCNCLLNFTIATRVN